MPLQPIDPPADLVEPFKDPLANLVDGILELVDQESVALLHEALAGGLATLRLAVNVAPDLSMVLYVIAPTVTPPHIVLARFGAEPIDVGPPPAGDRPN